MDDQPVVDGGEIPIGICAKLREPIDWKLWEHTLLAHAHLLEIEDYVTKGKPSMEVPVEPSLHDIIYHLNSTALRLDLSNPDKARIPLQISHLTPESAAQFERDEGIFRAEMKQFSFHQASRRKLARWIISTTSPILFSLCCKANKDVHDWYMNLKCHFEKLLEDESAMFLIMLREVARDGLPRTAEEAGQWVDKWEDMMDKGHMTGHGVQRCIWETQIVGAVQRIDTTFAHELDQFLKEAGSAMSYKHAASRLRVFFAEKAENERYLKAHSGSQGS
ncbi:hypothetical protein KJ359_000209 [Pestalotiopsis sp. 9143b]|nr:hypothetical protein KJ359_000209 [Pestalotiopsis sp. 9143b]